MYSYKKKLKNFTSSELRKEYMKVSDEILGLKKIADELLELNENIVESITKKNKKILIIETEYENRFRNLN